MANSLLDHAVMLASHGWLIVPVLGKKPCGNEWQKHATNDPAALTRLFDSSHHDGFGVQLGERSGIVDFDADSEEAEATFQSLFSGDGPLTATFQSARGKHRFFRWSSKLPSPDKIKFIIDGLEVRTGSGDKGAQTVLPPSGERHWIVPPNACELAEIPADVLDRINARWIETQKPKNPKPQPIGFASSQPQPIGFVSSHGDSDSLDVPRWLKKHGREIIGRTEGGDGVTRWHIECPGIERHTTANSFRDCCISQGPSGVLGGCCFHSSCGFSNWSTLRSAIGELEYADFHTDSDVVLDLALPKVVSAELVTEDDDDDSVRIPVDPGAIKINMSSTPGVLGAMVRYNLDFAPRPQAELAFFSALTAVSAACGQLIRSKSDLRPNLCVMVLSEAGSGKDFPRFQTESALRQSGNEARIGPEKLRSDKTFVRFLHERGSLLIQTDEVMGYFEAVQNKGAAMHVQNIVAIIKEAATSAKKSHWNPMGTGDPAQDMVVPFPHLNMFCTGTKGAWLSFDGKSVRDGFLPRFLIYETTEKASRLRPDLEPGEIPETILGPLRDWAVFRQAGGSGNLVCLPASLRPALIVPVDSAAIDRFRQHSTGIEDRYLTDSDDAATCWRRASASAQQLALVIAAARGPYGIQISLDDANLAIKIVNHTTRVVIDRVFRYVGENEYDTERKRALSLIRESGSMSGREFCRRMKIGIIKRGLILSDLTSQGYVRVSTDGAKNQISVVYVTG